MNATASSRTALRHPRRFGFLIFNLLAAITAAAWLLIRWESTEAGIGGLPNVALTTAGLVVLAIIWLGSWVAWGAMVWSRHRRDKTRVP